MFMAYELQTPFGAELQAHGELLSAGHVDPETVVVFLPSGGAAFFQYGGSVVPGFNHIVAAADGRRKGGRIHQQQGQGQECDQDSFHVSAMIDVPVLKWMFHYNCSGVEFPCPGVVAQTEDCYNAFVVENTTSVELFPSVTSRRPGMSLLRVEEFSVDNSKFFVTPKQSFRGNAMKKTATALAATVALSLGSSLTQAQDKGALFHNGLSVNIVEAHAARAEKCEVFNCGQWERIDNPDRVLAPRGEAMILRFAAREDQAETVCKWDIKLLTQPLEGGTITEHVFRFMDFCVGGGYSRVSFTREEYETVATQIFTDQGQRKSVKVVAGK